jgi:hypothetical protein
MKAIFFLAVLATPEGTFPIEPVEMPSMQACIERVQEKTEQVLAINADYVFAAACQIRSQKQKES